ncbi:MAG: PP2C family protein-serine/threonine phosphatase [bacterium]|nr:PP2C family protein-serine/threonine phosphatase [bacterium]
MATQRESIVNIISRLVLILAILLSISGLLERWTGPDLPFNIRRHKIITRVGVSGSPLAPLVAGDSLITIAGRPVRSDVSAIGALTDTGRTGPVAVEFTRDGQLLHESLEFNPPSTQRLVNIFLRTLAALFIFLIGFYVVSKRRDVISRHFLFLTLLTGSLLSLSPRTGIPPWSLLLEWKNDLVATFLPPVFFYFVVLFPERRPRPRWLKILIFLPPCVFALLGTLALLGLPLLIDPGSTQLLQLCASLNAALLLILSLLLITYKALRKKYRREQSRVRLVLFGAFISVLPLAIFQLLHQILPGRHIYLQAWTHLFLAFLPLSFAYGILGPDLPALQRRTRAILRTTLSGSLLAALFITFRMLIYLFWGQSTNIGDDILSELFSLGASLLLLPTLRNRLILQFGEREGFPFNRCQHALTPPNYFSTLESLKQDLLPKLGEESGAIWLLCLEMGSKNSWAISSSWDPDSKLRILDSKGKPRIYTIPPGLEKMLLQGKMLAVEQWDPYWAQSLIGPHALSFCKSRDWCLLLPVLGDEDNPLLFIFGPSISGTLYHGNITRGMEQLQASLDLHLRNLSLLCQVTREERLLGELDIARDIQLGLLPRQIPNVPNLELAGRMQASSEVGGDYYGFLELLDDRLGLALGDATGHGVPAALLISTVAMVFHYQAKNGISPEYVLQGMNTDLMALPFTFDRSGGVFAGFVYALYDRNSSTLFYSNGGMPPPILLRADGNMERLSRGGLPLGLSADGQYSRGLLSLNPGDLLIMRSDGVEDQEDNKGDAFGEARLLKCLANRDSESLDDIADSLITTLKSYSGGELTDDISFILMRLT